MTDSEGKDLVPDVKAATQAAEESSVDSDSPEVTQHVTGTTIAELNAMHEDVKRARDEALATQPEELKQPDPQTPILVDGYKVDKGSLLQFDGYDQAKEPKYKVLLSGRTLQ